MKIPIVITILFFVIGILGNIYLAHLSFLNNDVVSNIIQMWACIAAVISATFVIYSYWITNQAFALSQKPRLRVAVVDVYPTDTKTGQKVHCTRINYENVSDNAFEDLTIKINLICDGKNINLENLFEPKMYMAPRDSRDRYFSTKNDIQEKSGFDFGEAETKNKEIVLSVAHEFTFCGKKEFIRMQNYIWEKDKQRWSIKYPV